MELDYCDIVKCSVITKEVIGIMAIIAIARKIFDSGQLEEWVDGYLSFDSDNLASTSTPSKVADVISAHKGKSGI